MSTLVDSSINDVLWPDTPFTLRNHAILVGRRGSEAHGLYVPPTEPYAIDDRDLMGVVIPPARYYFGLDRWEHAEAIKGQWDVVLYGLQKFTSLLCKQNPNVLSLLWVEREDYLLKTAAGMELVQHRDLFKARKAAHNAFVGYANGQLKRMTSFGEFRGYMGAKRKRLVEKFGYDTKNAAHLLRILRMGEEYLRTGELRVRRTEDRDELLAVKHGEDSLSSVQRRAEIDFRRCHDAFDESPLPLEIDHQAVRRLLEGITREALGL